MSLWRKETAQIQAISKIILRCGECELEVNLRLVYLGQKKKKKNTSLLPLALNYLPDLITEVFYLEITTWKICNFVLRTRRSCSGIDPCSSPHFPIGESGHPWFSTSVQSGLLLPTWPLLLRRVHTKNLFPSLLGGLRIEPFKNHLCHYC